MKKQYLTSPEAILLRGKAEKQLADSASTRDYSLTDIDSLKLVHELEVYQIELEMQNDQLQKANEQFEKSGDFINLNHELAVQQIELEIQNDELKKALQDTETATALYDFAPVGYFTIDLDRTIIQLNLRGAEMIGTERTALIGSHLGHFISQDTLPQFNEFIRLLFATEMIQLSKVSIIQNGKPTVYAFLRGCLSNDCKNCLITAVDITQLKLAETNLIEAKEYAEESANRLKLATISGQLGIWDWNVKDNVMIWDERMFELYGINQDTFPNNLDAWTNGIYPEDKQRAIDDCNSALNGEKYFNTMFRIVQPNGTILHIKADALVIRDIENKPIRMIGINKDITADKLVEEELKKSYRKLKYEHDLFIGRELKMIELKEEINALLKELGREQEYLRTD